MKKMLFLIIFLLIGINSVSAYDFICNNLCYTYINSSEVEVSGCYATGDIEIPQLATNPSNGNTATVKRIGTGAFKNANVTSINIPSTVTKIAAEAFKYCSSLEMVHLPGNVSTIGDNAFYGCLKLTSIFIPKSVTSLSWSSFDYCPSLSTITIHSANEVYDSREGCNAIIESATKRLIKGCNTTEIPQGVTAIGEAAFQYSRITAIDIPYGVTEIGNGAFRYCNNLANVKIPASVSSIGTYAFASDHSITSFIIEREVPISISDNVFSGITADQFVLYVPSGCRDAYKSATGWSRFNNIVEIKPEVEPLHGDINGDGKIDIADVTALVNMILNN